MQASSLSSCRARFVDIKLLSTDYEGLISNRESVAPARIGSPEAHARLLLDHDPFRVTQITQLCECVPTRNQRLLRIARQPKRLTNQLIRQPLVMNPRKIDRLLNIH